MYINDLKVYINQNVSETARYLSALDKVYAYFSDGDYHIISSPGRAEICGNHTDHQNGFVVATSLDIDNICFVKKNATNICTYIDEHFDIKPVNISDFTKHDDEINKAESIIRGIAKRFTDLGYKVGGFDAYCDSRVLVGSSLSSSACFEVMIAEIFNFLYNDGKVSAIEKAKISRWAENNYFGKPCGLMDQMAVSVGSFVGIDFFDKENPKIYEHVFSFEDCGYDFFIINTKGSHSDLTEEYASIPGEMKKIATYFKKDTLSEIKEIDFYNKVNDIRTIINNDRAILRAHHFFEENRRAKNMNIALEKSDIKEVLRIMNESGDSSYMYLQNVYPASNPKSQGISIALAISKKYLTIEDACRVQGGGFAGTIQAIVKKERAGLYIKEIKKVFGDDSVIKVNIRKNGTYTIV